MMYHNNKAMIAIFFLFISIVVQNTTSCKIDLNSNKIEWKLCQSQNINNLKHISFNKFLNTTTYQDECFPAIVPLGWVAQSYEDGSLSATTVKMMPKTRSGRRPANSVGGVAVVYVFVLVFELLANLSFGVFGDIRLLHGDDVCIL